MSSSEDIISPSSKSVLSTILIRSDLLFFVLLVTFSFGNRFRFFVSSFIDSRDSPLLVVLEDAMQLLCSSFSLVARLLSSDECLDFLLSSVVRWILLSVCVSFVTVVTTRSDLKQFASHKNNNTYPKQLAYNSLCNTMIFSSHLWISSLAVLNKHVIFRFSAIF